MSGNQLIALFREYVNEKVSTNPTPATVLIYLNEAYRRLNSAVGFYVKDDAATVTLVSGTQEYAIPTDLVRLWWVEYGGRLLKKSSMEMWRVQGVRWREDPPAVPEEYALYGRKLLFYPVPNVAGAVTLRYVAEPPALSATDTALATLATQDQPVIAYYAAGLWCQSSNSPRTSEAPGWFELFDREAKRMLGDYLGREVGP